MDLILALLVLVALVAMAARFSAKRAISRPKMPPSNCGW